MSAPILSRRRLFLLGLLLALVAPVVWVEANDPLPLPAAPLIADERFVFHPDLLDFDVAAYLRDAGSGLAEYREAIGGREQTAAESVLEVAHRYSISPKVLLALLEATTGAVSAPALDRAAVDRAFGGPEPGLEAQLDAAAQTLFTAYYGFRSAPDERAAAAGLNAGTFALAALSAAEPTFEGALAAGPGGFSDAYARLFGDPLDGALTMAAAPAPLPGARLPWTPGETWNYNSGPHANSGGPIGCQWGAAGCPTVWSAVDLAPQRPTACRYNRNDPTDPGSNDEGEKYTAQWAVAARDGTAIHGSAADGTVIVDHGDGWRTYYLHLAPTDKVAPGPISQGENVGHPSCQGRTDGIHLHFAVNYNGQFENIDGTTLGGWTVNRTTHYNGRMTCPDGRQQTADTRRFHTSLIADDCRPATESRLSVVLIIDSTGSMSSNDPSRMRVEAAKAFIDAAQPGDEIGVVDFETSGWVLSAMRVINSQADKDALKSAVDGVRQGGGTDINAGLDTGFGVLSAAAGPQASRAAILLTDGGHNDGPYRDSSHRQYADRGWPIYTVGFGQADMRLLGRIASETSGVCVNNCTPLANAAQLGQVYQAMRASLTSSTTIATQQFHIQQGQTRSLSANVMPSQFSALFYIGWEGSNMELTLIGPGGQIITPGTLGPGMTHAKGATYELYAMDYPPSGAWSMVIYGDDVPPGGETVSAYASSQGISHVYGPISVGNPPVTATPTLLPPTLTPPPDGSPTATPMPTATATATPDPATPWQEAGAGAASGGGISNNSGSSREVDIAAGPGNVVYVAWSDSTTGDAEIYVRRWDGGSWAELGGSASGGGVSNNGGASRWPSVAVGPDGRPWVAWHDDSTGVNEIYVRRWNGTAWEALAGSATGGGVSNNAGSSDFVALRVAPDGRAHVTWADATPGNDEIYVRRWNGSIWEALAGSASGGGISKSAGRSGRPALALDAAGLPWVAWSEGDGDNREIFLLRYDGAAWVPVGSSTGSGGISHTAGASLYATIDIGQTGAPAVAWYDATTGQWEVYAVQWNGSQWVPAGAGGASGGGLSNTAGESREPYLAIGPSGAPVVGWQEATGSDTEVYARWLSGNTWAEVGAGAATGGGVSNNSGQSGFPALAFTADGRLFAAWEDNSSGDYEIYVRVNGQPEG